jgi:hypothetical protein
VEKPLDTINNVFMLYKLATVGLLDSSLHSRDEARLIFEHPGNSIPYQLLGVLAVGNGQLLEPCFNVGGEMDFHEAQITGKAGAWQG